MLFHLNESRWKIFFFQVFYLSLAIGQRHNEFNEYVCVFTRDRGLRRLIRVGLPFDVRGNGLSESYLRQRWSAGDGTGGSVCKCEVVATGTNPKAFPYLTRDRDAKYNNA